MCRTVTGQDAAFPLLPKLHAEVHLPATPGVSHLDRDLPPDTGFVTQPVPPGTPAPLGAGLCTPPAVRCYPAVLSAASLPALCRPLSLPSTSALCKQPANHHRVLVAGQVNFYANRCCTNRLTFPKTGQMNRAFDKQNPRLVLWGFVFQTELSFSSNAYETSEYHRSFGWDRGDCIMLCPGMSMNFFRTRVTKVRIKWSMRHSVNHNHIKKGGCYQLLVIRPVCGDHKLNAPSPDITGA